MEMDKIRVLNTDICNIGIQWLLDNYQEGFLMPLNVDVLMKLQSDEEFYNLIQENKNKICICMDSQVIRIFARLILGKGFVEKVTGADFLPLFCENHRADEDIKIFLLGAGEGVALQAKENINKRTGREIVVDAHSPSFGFEKNEAECRNIVEKINASGANVLAVGVGAPKQEKWIFKHAQDLKNIKLFMAVGATIDFEAGNVERAPAWISNSGLEWLYRLTREPGRLAKRYLVEDMPFFWLLLKQRLGLYRDPFEMKR